MPTPHEERGAMRAWATYDDWHIYLEKAGRIDVRALGYSHHDARQRGHDPWLLQAS